MNNIFCITDSDILNVYKKENFNHFNNCQDYIKFINIQNKSNIKKLSNKFNVSYRCLLHWNKEDRKPYGIKGLDFLKENNLLPFYPNKKVARIIGFLHGDGWLTRDLGSFGFVSSNLNELKDIKRDVEEMFKIKGKIEKKRDKGDVVFIHGKESKATKPTYHLEFNSKAICNIIHKLGVPKGRKVTQRYKVPKWIIEGNKSVKIAFLQGLFDAELSNFQVHSYGSHKNNISSLRMELAKEEKLQKNLNNYLKQIKKLLKDIMIKANIKYLRKYKENRIALSLIISNKLKNLYNFIEDIGFYYSQKKSRKSLEVKNLIIDKFNKSNSKV